MLKPTLKKKFRDLGFHRGRPPSSPIRGELYRLREKTGLDPWDPNLDLRGPMLMVTEPDEITGGPKLNRR